MRQHAGCGAPARRWQSRPRRLGDRIAIPTGIFRPDMPDHPEPPRDIVEHLSDVFAKPGHGAAAGRAGAGAVVLRFVHDLLPGQVVRQLLALGLASLPDRQRPVFGGGLADRFGLAGFQLLEPQFELFDLPGHALRGATKLHPPQLGDLELQLLDLQGAQLDGEPCRLQLRGRRRQFALAGQGKSPQRVRVGGRIGRGQRHTLSLSKATAGRPEQTEKSLICYNSMGRGGAGGAIVRRQSIASISNANCAGVSVIVSSTSGGQTNLPRSRRLANRHMPLPSQYRPFK
jgi:hypothetical protein